MRGEKSWFWAFFGVFFFFLKGSQKHFDHYVCGRTRGKKQLLSCKHVLDLHNSEYTPDCFEPCHGYDVGNDFKGRKGRDNLCVTWKIGISSTE